MIKTENWNGYNIRFIEQDGEWFAVLKDVCEALDLKSKHVSKRLDTEMMIRVKIEALEDGSNDLNSRGANSFWMLAVNELGIYETLFASRKLEARKFRRWSSTVLQKLRRRVGLEDYEIMRMADSDIQEDIDNLIDTLFYDETTGKIMQSITVQGGDVEQVEFE